MDMLDSHELQQIQAKKISDAYLFSKYDFRKYAQEMAQDTKNRVNIIQKSEDLRIGCDDAEELLIKLGFIRSETSFDDKMEFMKLWKIMIQMQEEQDTL